MVVSWLTADSSPSTVMWGLDSGNYVYSASGNQTSYSSRAGYNHNVKLENLTASTTYYYIAGDSSYAWSQEFNFTTGPASFQPFTVCNFGDMGIDHSNNTLNSLLRMTAAGDFDLYTHMGDISYADDHPVKYEETWNEWFDSMQPIMATIPYMVAPGNHEKWSRNPFDAVATSNFTTYKEKFRMPGPECGTNTNMFYSFDYMNVHFVSVSTESDYPGAPFDPSPDAKEGVEVDGAQEQEYYYQVNWLSEDLAQANANRENVPWIIVYAHRPIYSPNEQKNGAPDGTAANVQAWLEPVFKEYNVDFYLTGHVHAYARMWPTYNNEPVQFDYNNPTAPVYLVAGGAGNREGLNTFGSDLPSWVANTVDYDYGFGAFTVWNNTHITYNYYTATNGDLVDSITVVQENH